MKRKILSAVALLIAILCIPASLVFAHSGGTDENGGHWERSTGTYHYHHGYPAHQHPNGVCPYLTETSEDSTDTYYDDGQQDDDNVGGYFINDDVSSRYSELSEAAEQLGGNYTTKVLADISSAAYRDGYQEGYEDGLAYRKENPSAAAASTARGDAETISELGGYTGKDYNVAVSNAYDEGYSDALETLEYEEPRLDDIESTSFASQYKRETENNWLIFFLFLGAFFGLLGSFVLYRLWREEEQRADNLHRIAEDRGDRIKRADAYIDYIRENHYIPSPDDDEN